MKRLVAALLFLAPVLHGQTPAAPVNTRILTYAPGGLPASLETYYRTADRIEVFRASAGTLGLPIEYSGPQSFALYGSKADLNPPAAGQAAKPPLASATLPAGADVVLIVCTSQPEGKIRLTAYDISSDDLKKGDYRVFNFSKAQVSVILDKQRFALSPAKDAMVRDSAWHGEPVAFPIQIATVTAGKAKLVYSTFWEHYPQRRNLIFLFDGRHASEPITFATFNADLPPPAKRPAATAAAP